MLARCGALAQLRGYFTPNMVFSFLYNNNDLYTILPYNCVSIPTESPVLYIQLLALHLSSFPTSLREFCVHSKYGEMAAVLSGCRKRLAQTLSIESLIDTPYLRSK
jgi:hypothetical protein